MTNDYMLFYLLIECDSVVYKDAAQEVNWLKDMSEGIEAIRRNDTWELITLPDGHEHIGVKNRFTRQM